MFERRIKKEFVLTSPRLSAPASSCSSSSSVKTLSPSPLLSASLYSTLYSLDSVLLRPAHWQSAYTKKLAYTLSLQASSTTRRDRLEDNPPSSLHTSCLLNNSRNLPQQINREPRHKMISAVHQFSTIKTQYSDDQRAYVSQVNPMRPMLVQVEFEIFGELSGIHFTKYAKGVCENLNLKGWIRVSPRGSIYGLIQGEKDKVDEMVIWLKSQGSPTSKITGSQFRNWKIIESCDFRNMSLRY